MAEWTFSSSEESMNEVELRARLGITERGEPRVALGAYVPNATWGTVIAGTAIGFAACCGLAWILQRGRRD